MSNQGKWIVNLSEEGIWSSADEFDTKEQAIDYGKGEFDDIYESENGEKFDSEIYRKTFYIGQIERYVPSVCVDSVIETIKENASDEVGEFADDFLERISREEYGFLEQRLNEVLNEWLDETKNNPTFWKIVNVEKVEI